MINENHFSLSSSIKQLSQLHSMKIVIFIVLSLLIRADDHPNPNSCPESCFCTLPEGEQIGITWLTCSRLPEQFPSTAKYLTVKSSRVSSLNQEILSPFKTLEYLSLKKLEIEKIEENSFVDFNNLQTLDLFGNLLHNVTNNTFNRCPLLEELFLGGNQIMSIESGAFNHLSRLKKLDLSANFIRRLPDSFPESLTELDASRNLITELPKVSTLLHKLSRLDLCGNKFIFYNSDHFKAPFLIHLCLGDYVQIVDLSLSTIRSFGITSDAFSTDSIIDVLNKMPQLESLSLGHMTFIKIRRNGTLTLRLHTLELRKIGIDDIDESFFLFRMVNGLETLNIDASPRFASFILSSDQMLSKFSSLQNLKLHQTNTIQITTRQARILKNLRTLTLSENPLLCNCDIEWIVSSVRNNSLVLLHPQLVICSSPKKFRGLQLFSQQVSENLCRSTDTPGDFSRVNNNTTIYKKSRINGITVYHVLYIIIGLTVLLIVAFVVVIILLCKARRVYKQDEASVVYRRRDSIDLVPQRERRTSADFSSLIFPTKDQVIDEPTAYSSVTFHPRRSNT